MGYAAIQGKVKTIIDSLAGQPHLSVIRTRIFRKVALCQH